MSHAKDIDEREADAAGLLLMDLLYGELDGKAADQARQRLRQLGTEPGGEMSGEPGSSIGNEPGSEIDKRLDQELAAFSSLRAMLRELPEEEPPAQLTAKLMHAAAAHASQAAQPATEPTAAPEQRGLWAWLKSLVQPISMYPGLAAATSLVLMVGVAGTLYMSGRWDAADPSRAPMAAPTMPAAAPARANEPPGEGMAESARAAAPQAPIEANDDMADRAVLAEPAVTGGSLDSESRGRAAVSTERKAKEAVGEGASKKSSRASAGKAASSAELGDFDGLASDSDGRQAASLADKASGGAAMRLPAKPKAEVAGPAPAAPPPAPVSAPAAEEEAPMQQAPASSAPKADSSATARLRAMHDDARASAAKGDCDAVVKIGTSIRRLDERYYTGTFRSDPTLAACLGQSQKN